MELIKETKHLAFVLAPSTGKTKVIAVVSISHEEIIGEIRWFSRWRQYCFFPYTDTVWSTSCMEDVQTVIDELHEERKINLKSKNYEN